MSDKLNKLMLFDGWLEKKPVKKSGNYWNQLNPWRRRYLSLWFHYTDEVKGKGSYLYAGTIAWTRQQDEPVELDKSLEIKKITFPKYGEGNREEIHVTGLVNGKMETLELRNPRENPSSKWDEWKKLLWWWPENFRVAGEVRAGLRAAVGSSQPWPFWAAARKAVDEEAAAVGATAADATAVEEEEEAESPGAAAEGTKETMGWTDGGGRKKYKFFKSKKNY